MGRYLQVGQCTETSQHLVEPIRLQPLFPGFSQPFLPVGPPCSCVVVLIKASLSCCDSSDIVY